MPSAARLRTAGRLLAGALPAAGLLAVAVAPGAQAASSASYQINNAVLDAAGGTSSSASHTVTACVGSEIAGTQSSANHRIDSGCGPSALAIALDFPFAGTPKEIPAISGAGLAVLVALLAAVAIRRLRASSR
ncbi:MAG: hypothetical protein IPO58_23340 [Betaproteobacteria bacterium]|nr:hypothetical protein [Betaproteobacteria bacterium]